MVKDDMTACNVKLAALEWQLKQSQDEIKKLQDDNRMLKSSLLTKRYIASKQGKKAYQEGSLHAKNIKHKIIFDNKQQAVAAGYKAE